MSTIAAPSRSASAATKAAPRWMFNGPLDLLVIANVGWPLIVGLSMLIADQPAAQAFGFLVAYFVIMPHRWITLALVFCDRQRFESRRYAFISIAITAMAAVSLTQASFGTLALLMAFDWLWNAWHFAAQHGGIARIYDRMARPESTSTGLLDKLVLRTLAVFAIFRLTGTTVPTLDNGTEYLGWLITTMNWLSVLDWAVIALPLVLLVREVLDFRPAAIARIVYLLSVWTLYGTMLYATRQDQFALRFGCAMAASVFHSVEYLAIVSWSLQKNKPLHSKKPFVWFMPRWAVTLITFMTFCVLSAVLLKGRFYMAWACVNLVVSFLHYAYDGMIWKRPKQKPAV
jgi:hypothetical protein